MTQKTSNFSGSFSFSPFDAHPIVRMGERRTRSREKNLSVHFLNSILIPARIGEKESFFAMKFIKMILDWFEINGKGTIYTSRKITLINYPVCNLNRDIVVLGYDWENGLEIRHPCQGSGNSVPPWMRTVPQTGLHLQLID